MLLIWKISKKIKIFMNRSLMTKPTKKERKGSKILKENRNIESE